jgi:hypothetical protein
MSEVTAGIGKRESGIVGAATDRDGRLSFGGAGLQAAHVVHGGADRD